MPDERRGWLEAFAIELAELRWLRHVTDEHGCGLPGGGGMAYCPVAMEFMEALPRWWFVPIG